MGSTSAAAVTALPVIVPHACARATCSSSMRARAGRRAGRRCVLLYFLLIFYICTDLGSQDNITRSKEEAIEILHGHQAQINGSADAFGALAQQHSDCPSHSNAGDLGWFGPGQMQKPFESATYGLDVGQISDVVETDSGVHLIMRTG
jgi:hypothetical protein